MQIISQMALNNLPSIIGLFFTIISIYYGFKFKIQELEKENHILKSKIKEIENKLLTLLKNKILIETLEKDYETLDNYTKKNIEILFNRIRSLEIGNQKDLYSLRKDVYQSLDKKIINLKKEIKFERKINRK